MESLKSKYNTLLTQESELRSRPIVFIQVNPLTKLENLPMNAYNFFSMNFIEYLLDTYCLVRT